MSRTIPLGLFLIGLAAVGAGCAHETTSVERGANAAEPWISLFNGHDMSGWKPLNPANNTWKIVGGVTLEPSNNKHFVATPGDGIVLNSADGQTTNIVSERSFGDCETHIEWAIPKGSNSGIYFETKYELQILDSYGKKEPDVHDAGAIYSQWINEQNVNGHAPRVNVALAPGEWQSFDAIFHAPRFDASGQKVQNARFDRVMMNGTVIHQNVEVLGPTRAALPGPETPDGPFMIQGDHGPVAFRSFRVRPLK